MDFLTDINWSFVAITAIASFVACFFSSLAGGGAGLILLPILIFTGLPFLNALASHQMAVAFIGLGSTYRYAKEKLIDWKIFWWTGVLGIPFVYLGAQFVNTLDGEMMKTVVGAVVIFMVAISLLIKKAGIKHIPQVNTKILILGSFLLMPMAFYSGWISVASGVFTTFLYVHLMKYDQLHATAMTLGANGILWNITGALTHLSLGNIVWEIAPGLIIGALLGSYAGAAFGVKKGNKWMKFAFLGSAIITGIILLFQ